MTAERSQQLESVTGETDTNTDTEIVLVVDLDGTLCRTDTLHESFLRLVSEAPLMLFRLPKWLAEGKASLKARLADRAILPAAELPLNPSVVKTIRTARENGRRTALVSAADDRQVKAIAEAIGIFDEAFGSAEGRNLKGPAKAAFLAEHFGARMFDYIGDSKADLPVWAAAHRAISVQAGTRLRREIDSVNALSDHIDPPAPRLPAMLKALRPHQWSKNLLMFLPVLAAHQLSDLPSVLLGFIAFCLTASAVYIINDLMDLAADRSHPRKRKRPFAAGDLSAVNGAALTGGLLIAALVFGLLIGNPLFLGTLALYFVATFIYSLWLKRRLIVDVIMLAGLYTVRIIAGAAAVMVPLSPWMLGFSLFLFLALAAVKRQTELTDQMKKNRPSQGRAYDVEDLPILRSMSLSAGNATILVLALYITSEDVQALYTRPWLLWLVCPLLLYWITRMVMKTHRGQMTDDPIVFAVTDLVSIFLIATCAAIVVLAAV